MSTVAFVAGRWDTRHERKSKGDFAAPEPQTIIPHNGKPSLVFIVADADINQHVNQTMLTRVVSFSLLLGIARSSPWPHQPCILGEPLLATPLSFVGAPASTTTVSNSDSRQHRPGSFRTQRKRTFTINDRRCSGTNDGPRTTGNPLRPGSRHPAHASSSSLSMGRRTELGASPWKTDSRTVQEWLEFSERELRKIEKVLGPPRTGLDLEERLGLLADGKTDSVVVRKGAEVSINRDGWPGEIAGLTCDVLGTGAV